MPLGIHIPRKYVGQQTQSQGSRSYTPTPGPGRPHHLSKSNPKKPRPLVYLSHGATLSQTPGLTPIPGQIGFAGDRPQDGLPRPPAFEPENEPSTNEYSAQNLMFLHDESEVLPHNNGISRHRRRRLNQSNRWLNEVIPALVLPYMKLVQQTESFCLYPPPASESLETTCICEHERLLNVMVVHFFTIESIELRICQCTPAAPQLVKKGLFPSTPISPSLAVDIRVLEFVSRLFLNMAPNNTAWCKTVEDFLDTQGYKLPNKDSLRKRFGETLRWFNTLQDRVDQHVQNTLLQARQTITPYEDGNLANNNNASSLRNATTAGDTVIFASSTGSPSDSQSAARKRRRESAADNDEQPPSEPSFPEPLPRDRPSDYLRRRCPLCFGGQFPRPGTMKGPDAIVCVDACFKQKRNKGEKDPPRTHSDSVFLSETTVRNAEEHTENIRPSTKPKKKAKRSRGDNIHDDKEDDGYDGPLRVPRSVLATCQESFTAADDQRQKASTQFFSETALMALLCRHDRVLWIVSMTSAGEKQHYTFALLETLFQHLPLNFQIGLLYDIGCQLHQSCVKWGFLDRYLARLTFAISVFHAFGHQWACQVIYHPRKCLGFGLSDGEGCERLWKSLQDLIPYLRVCGHFQRLYTLDRQILHAEDETLLKFGQWLLRRTRHTHEKRVEAEETLLSCGKPLNLLRQQWENQVASQTKPLPRQSKNKGKDAIEQALQLRKAREMLMRQITGVEDLIADELTEGYLVADAELRLPDLQAKLDQTTSRLRSLERSLGVDEKAKLKQMINNPFISARMNARALKIRLREKLRSRKFELERLERSFRHQVNEHKVDEHTAASVQRRDPGIQKLARDYNKLCALMYDLKRQGKAPRGALCPEEIELGGLFALDVDDDIWQDIGLSDDLDTDTSAAGTPPLWLCDDNVRSGIKAMLQLDRCIEEEERLSWERLSLQIWYAEEWKVVCKAIEEANCEALSHQLTLRKSHLLSLLATWMKTLQSVLPLRLHAEIPPWGPTEDEIVKARVLELSSSTVQTRTQCHDGEDLEDDESILSENEVEPVDSTLLDTLEAVDMADVFRRQDVVDL